MIKGRVSMIIAMPNANIERQKERALHSEAVLQVRML